MSKRMVRWFAAEFGLAVAISFAVAAARELRLAEKPAAPGPAAPEPAVGGRRRADRDPASASSAA